MERSVFGNWNEDNHSLFIEKMKIKFLDGLIFNLKNSLFGTKDPQKIAHLFTKHIKNSNQKALISLYSDIAKNDFRKTFSQNNFNQIFIYGNQSQFYYEEVRILHQNMR